MLFYKKVLLLFIIILFSYILYRIYKKRCETKNHEGLYFDKTPEQEINDIKNTDVPIQLTSISSAYTNVPISQFAIKGSYNTAITKNFVSLDMIQYVLSRGCRFIDFEVFFIDKKPMVSYSNDPNFSVLETKNKILLENVLSSAVASGFNSPSPNIKDPLFIQLRVKSIDMDVYNEIAKSIKNTLFNRLYKGEITKTTKMSEIMGKVIIVMDRTVNYKYRDVTKCKDPNDKTCYDLTKFINIDSGSEFLRTSSFDTILSKKINPPIINNNNLTTNVEYMQIATPEIYKNNSDNPDSYKLIQKYGCQILLYRFYSKDDRLSEYETLFNENLYGIIPLSFLIMYIEKHPN